MRTDGATMPRAFFVGVWVIGWGFVVGVVGGVVGAVGSRGVAFVTIW